MLHHIPAFASAGAPNALLPETTPFPECTIAPCSSFNPLRSAHAALLVEEEVAAQPDGGTDKPT